MAPYLHLNLATWLFTQLLLLLLLFRNADCGHIVKTLPGFPGELPFKLESGYIGVEQSELYYIFVESTGHPRTDPLLLYLVGGPGCSGFNGFFYQTGPLAFNDSHYNGGLPELYLRPYAWTKTASIIFLDAPVGTGFSYANDPEGLVVSDTSSARQTYKFLRKWLAEHPQYMDIRIFIASDSYSGIVAPIIVQYILDDNAAGVKPHLKLIGLISGSPHQGIELEANAEIEVAYRLGLIGNRLYQRARESCKGQYFSVDSSNKGCEEALGQIDELLNDIYLENVLGPKCVTNSPKPDEDETQSGRRRIRSLQGEKARRFSGLSFPQWWCKNSAYALSYAWANNETVKEALRIREGTVEKWYRCNLVIEELYNHDIASAFSYQKNFTKTDLQVLLYTGDHDLVVPHLATEQWLRALNITTEYSWRPWFVDGQVAGYKIIYQSYSYRLTYLTVKGSGHSPTEYYNKKSYEMFARWIHFYPV
ncbi:serine carboxypeptidase-like 16 [Prosopis cineraria]|uniref:serine carboxypeptidase-like 16 n=1 Tax=Prosopis cineraria TaxID=364024 RepID=UPI00240EDA68|nr:serine carboxypeptidase-like 16 [Prosopis cineraria]